MGPAILQGEWYSQNSPGGSLRAVRVVEPEEGPELGVPNTGRKALSTSLSSLSTSSHVQYGNLTVTYFSPYTTPGGRP